MFAAAEELRSSWGVLLADLGLTGVLVILAIILAVLGIIYLFRRL